MWSSGKRASVLFGDAVRETKEAGGMSRMDDFMPRSWRGLGEPLEALGGQDRKMKVALCFFEASGGGLGALRGRSCVRLGLQA